MTPSIGVVIATPGRRSILRTMSSILFQGIKPGDDVLIVGDGYHKGTADLVDAMGAPFRYVATEQTRDWGHSQVNYGLQHVRGDWVTINDDDDIFMPRAFDEMRSLIAIDPTPRVILGRVVTPYLGLLWKEPQVEPLDGHCIVVPNDKKKLGYFGLEYAGDQKWITSNIEQYDRYTWADRVWAFARPTWNLWPTLHSNTGEARLWSFDREFLAPGAEEVARLRMSFEDGRWMAEVQDYSSISESEAEEIAQFAAWAGQGHDVWIRIARINSDNWGPGIERAGYELHQNAGEFFDAISAWPPLKCIPKRES